MVKLKDKWKMKGSKTSWYIATIEKDVVGLSGPGPARGMIYVTMEDLKDEWEKVEEAKASEAT